MKRTKCFRRKIISAGVATAMTLAIPLAYLPNSVTVEAAEPLNMGEGVIANDSLSVQIGDLGQISTMNILNNRQNSFGEDVNFVLPNDTSPQNDVQHQWMGEMIFSYRASADGSFPEDNTGFVEVDTNKTLAAGGSTTYSDATENLEDNPYIDKNVVSDKKVEVDFKGQELTDTGIADDRIMRGFDVESVFDMETEDGSLLWNITISNTSDQYLEFGDVGLPMPWNNKYTSVDSVYNERVTAHTFAGADSGYAYAIRCSGEGNYILFTPVPESGARIEYVDNWVGNNNGVTGERADDTFKNWTSDSGGWQPGLSVYYVHSKDIQQTGRGYYTDATSLVLDPGESQTYQFKFSAIRAGDNTPQDSAESENNKSDSMEERESNMRSVLYNSGMIDAIAVPGFQTALNMPTKLDLHYDETKIKDVEVDIQCVHENDPFDEEHIPVQGDGLVNNSRGGQGEHGANSGYTESCTLAETKVVDGESHHVYDLTFGCIGNNSVRVNYKLQTAEGTWEEKFTQYEFNVLSELDDAVETHAQFMTDQQQDNDPDSATYGMYNDWYLSSGADSNAKNHWGDDWGHDNINFMTMKNYLDPDAEEVQSIEKYLIDYMWDSYMKNTQDTYTVANYLSASSIYSDSEAPYTRTYSQMMEATGFFNMYRIQKAYPDLIDYRETALWYLDKAYGIYLNNVDAGVIGYYGEQQVPDMIEALRSEGMTEEADNLQEHFAKDKGNAMLNYARYPYGSEFAYDNTGEEGAYSALKALLNYYPDETDAAAAYHKMSMAEWKTRAMRGIQPTWYQYADPVFIGGESWWNFQYTASLAGYIMDDYLRYQDNGWDTDSGAWAQRVNYAAKLSNFNSINMGQISADSIGAVSWRYTMYKGGHGAMNVNDGGTRVMNNGWNDFSGESDEGLYGSLLSISSDVVTDPIFGLYGYGSTVSSSGEAYTVTPLDGFGKRINDIDHKLYVTMVQDSVSKAVINHDGTRFELNVVPGTVQEHLSQIKVSGAGLADGWYTIKVNGKESGQFYVKDKEGTANVVLESDAEAVIVLESTSKGENTAPVITKAEAEAEDAEAGIQAMVSFNLTGEAYDDGYPDGTLAYTWEVAETPEGAKMTIDSEHRTITAATADTPGTYKVKLTVSDGELETEKIIDVAVGDAPEKTAPQITGVSAWQDEFNTTTAVLSATAEADPLYDGELSYEWSIPEDQADSGAVIADADSSKAVLKVNAPGEYTVNLVVKDGDLATETTVSVTMSDAADGVERLDGVVTEKGKAPALPEKAEVITADGLYTEGRVEWEDVSADSYAKNGSFLVSGVVTAGEYEVPVKLTVYVVEGDERNLAPDAEASAIINTPWDLGGVEALNNGYDPASSADTSHYVWHNWLGQQDEDAWVQYTWNGKVILTGTDAYYFKDGSGNFQPKDIRYQYLDDEGNWQDIVRAAGCGNELNQYNYTSFEPVSTTAIRMNMSPVTKGCGVIEWKVYGYSDTVSADKTELRALIAAAKGYNGDLIESGMDVLETAIAEGESVVKNAEAVQADVNVAMFNLNEAMRNLVPKDGNVAYLASVSYSFISSWETPSAPNDGIYGSTSDSTTTEDGTRIPHFGSWGNVSDHETVTYIWNNAVTFSSTDIYFWTDNGGILWPASYKLEYLNSDGQWTEVAAKNGYPQEKDMFNTVEFDELTTTGLRMTINKQENDGDGVGLVEWRVSGNSAKTEADKTELINKIEEIAQLDPKVYTDESWNALQKILERAIQVRDDKNAGQGTVDEIYGYLTEAVEDLETVSVEEKVNIAKDAAATGSADYLNDLGGVKTLNDGFEPANSADTSNGTWHNWNDRDKDAWVQYTWDKPVTISSMEAYYFRNEMGSFLPEAAEYEYLTKDGEWKTLPNVQGQETLADQYNVTTFDPVTTTAVRMKMTPEDLPGDPFGNKGCGVIEWKVYGEYAKEDIDLTKLEALLAEAEQKNEEDYVSGWDEFLNAKAVAQAVLADPKSQSDVDKAVESLAEAIKNLEPAPEKPVTDKSALKALLEEYSALKEKDYTEESWDIFSKAMQDAENILNDEEATQEEVNAHVILLQEAKEQLRKAEQPSEGADKDKLNQVIAEAEKLGRGDYTDASWDTFAKALAKAQSIAGDPAADQTMVDAACEELETAMAGLEKRPGANPGTDTQKPSTDPSKPGGDTDGGKEAVKTGDNTSMIPAAAAVLLSGALIAGTIMKRRKRR